jgi:hypothetical protein
MSRVDRSYSKYESIRTYEDRGKMKWNPFATAELASAHRDYHLEFTFQEPGFKLEEEDIKTMLSFAKTLRLPITIELKNGKQTEKVSGIVIDWVEREGIRLQKLDGHYQEITFASIINLTDEQFFDDYKNNQ